VNIIPDLQERLAAMNLVEATGYDVVKQQEGGDRFVDDVFVSPDGRTLYLSRGNLDDAIAFDIASKTILWRFRLDGFKADHAALSPDGKRFVVSATTAQAAQVLDTSNGTLVGILRRGRIRIRTTIRQMANTFTIRALVSRRSRGRSMR